MDGTGFDSTASVYTEAKGEYTKQLTVFIIPAFHLFFMELLAVAVKEEPIVKKQLWKFQELLSQVPEWNIDKVQREVQKIIHQIHCDYLEELVTAVFIAHTKVLTAIRISNKNKRVQITIPKLEHFIHRALTECSRLLWSSAYLFHNDLPAMEKQKNHREIERLLQEGIAQAIRSLLPVKNILKDYLAEPEGEQDDVHHKGDKDDKGDSDDSDDEREDVQRTKESLIGGGDGDDVGNGDNRGVVEETSARHNDGNTAESYTGAEVSGDIKVIGGDLQDTHHNNDLHTIDDKINELTLTNPETQQESNIHQIPDTTIETIIPANTNIVNTTDTPVSHPESIVPTSLIPPTPPTPPTPQVPVIVIDTEPTVRFTDYDQVIQQQGETTHISYVPKDRSVHESDEEEDRAMQFLEEEGEPLSDFEDLSGDNDGHLSDNDFEEL
jgi:hypothetical protein